jgi:hypothetical protein
MEDLGEETCAESRLPDDVLGGKSRHRDVGGGGGEESFSPCCDEEAQEGSVELDFPSPSGCLLLNVM